ncbi:MAG: hypothetical protein MRZ79_12390 [Bacteroidia bacterium]|nr:hypothetical protein [Bacteroidia bacterium]
MKRIIQLFLLLIVLGSYLQAQVREDYQKYARPSVDENIISARFKLIPFSKAEMVHLQGSIVSLTFDLDEKGKASLREVVGVRKSPSDPSLKKGIIEKFRAKTLELNNFQPKIEEWLPVKSTYTMDIRFPRPRKETNWYGLKWEDQFYRRYGTGKQNTVDDFEYIKKSRRRGDIAIGMVGNRVLGSASDNLLMGGGFRMDFTIGTTGGNYLGIFGNLIDNNFVRDYDEFTGSQSFSLARTSTTGLTGGRWFNNMSVQLEVGFASQTLIDRSKDAAEEESSLDLDGWTSGVVVNYPIKIGKESIGIDDGWTNDPPSLTQIYANVHLGVRYMDFSLDEASGFTVELGLSLRIGMFGIQSYQLKARK